MGAMSPDERPPPPDVWAGPCVAFWPDGSQSDLDLSAHAVRVGDRYPHDEGPFQLPDRYSKNS